MEIKNKKCPTCKRTLELNNDNFYKNKRTKNGFTCYCKACSKILRKKNYNRDPIIVYNNNLKRLYGITYKDYLELLENQNYRCGICKLTIEEANSCNVWGKNKRFHVDHNHKTGEIRGLLCNNCNTGLGYFKESPLILKTVIQYLKNNGIEQL